MYAGKQLFDGYTLFSTLRHDYYIENLQERIIKIRKIYIYSEEKTPIFSQLIFRIILKREKKQEELKLLFF